MPYPDRLTRRLIRQITEAFADTPMPSGEVIPGTCHCDECLGVQEFFAGRHWTQLLRKSPLWPALEHGMHFLSSEAWHFYLPAFLVGSIKHDKYHAFQISPKASVRFPEHQTKQFALLTAMQCRAVQAYLEECRAVSAGKYDPASRTGQRLQQEFAAALAFWRRQEQGPTASDAAARYTGKHD